MLELLSEYLIKRITVDENDCWIWTGHILVNGYGTGNGGRIHRVVYELLIGKIPDGLVIDHLCRVRACCNPKHLEPVTAQENVLRGEGLAAINSAKIYCDSGHSLSGSNLYIKPNGCRNCRECRRISNRKYRARRAL